MTPESSSLTEASELAGIPALAAPDLEGDPETQRVHSEVFTRLFGDEPEVAKIGRYPVIAQVGRGAMGMVYACYDSELDRRIAVKLLLNTGESADHARMVREAQAMARLSHPNVAHVYEVGSHGGRTFVAMEFVKGQTLGAWLKVKPHWRSVLSTCVAAGRGLAAAHDAGLTHRDFKPENVMVGDDGRVCVVDFGIVQIEADLPSPQAPQAEDIGNRVEALTQERLTQRGARLGTPAYMAPEQLRGSNSGRPADQFSFCVTLWEALHGQRPFAGRTLAELAENVEQGAIVEAASTNGVPRWLRRVLARGLRVAASERFATMADLLKELERGTTRSRLRWVAVAVALVVSLGLGAEGLRRYRHALLVAGCEAEGASISETWNDEVRSRVKAALVTSGVSYGATTAETAVPWIDAHADAWLHARTEACMDVAVRDVWDTDLFERSSWCLDDRRMELEALIDEYLHADPTVAQRAVMAAAGLPSVEDCRDVALLQRLPLPPLSQREELRAVREDLSRSGARLSTGKFLDGITISRRARTRAEALGSARLAATARAIESRLLEREGIYVEAELAGQEAYFEAASVGAWGVAADAASTLVLLAERRARFDEGRMWASHGRLALTYAGDSERVREATLLSALGTVHRAAGDYSQARSLQDRAIAIQEAALGVDHPSIATTLNNLANVYQAMGEHGPAIALHERALSTRKRAFGAEHPDVAQSINNLANAHRTSGEPALARQLHVSALEMRERTLGLEHPDVAQSLVNLGNSDRDAGDHKQARLFYERALEIYRRSLGDDHPSEAHVLVNLGILSANEGKAEESRALQLRALGIRERALGRDHPDVASSLNNVAAGYVLAGDYSQAQAMLERALRITEITFGRNSSKLADILDSLAYVLSEKGEHEQASALQQRAVALLETALGADHLELASLLNNLAYSRFELGDRAEAVRILERAVLIYTKHEGLQRGELEAQFFLAEALVEVGGDAGYARELAEQARDGWLELGGAKAQEIARATAWLKKQKRRP